MVALLTEGVDRNPSPLEDLTTSEAVALLTEGVDRNDLRQRGIPGGAVALLTEGVDRNLTKATAELSLVNVALLTEGVDRNRCVKLEFRRVSGRPPHGGRG